ncbi:MAG: ethanolamine utilization protein, partial [Gammaproteobacteria bacterium]|nr:ethanolamine utilization protein [Gammaproteobacteria bacterium]
RRLREHPEICAWRLEEVEPGDFRPRLVFAEDVDLGAADNLYGPFNSKREATNTLRKIAEAYKLCPILLGLEKPNKTQRARTGHEPNNLHSARLMSALAKMKVKPWPWPGPVGLIERDDFRDVEDVHVLSGWRYLGTAHNPAEIHELLEQGKHIPFDLDTYKLLKTHLGKGKLKVRNL